MLISAAVCPHPPIIVPELAGAAAPELDPLRAACDRAVRSLLRTPDGSAGTAAETGTVAETGTAAATGTVLVVVGGGERTRRHPADAAGTLRPYGLDLVIGSGGPTLPLSLTIGRWLLTRAGAEPASLVEVGRDTPPEDCIRLGAELAASAERVALLVMGDGSACRSAAAPGYLDERAGPYDSAVARALERADPAVLAGLDPDLSVELQAAGRPAWQVLAGAATLLVTGSDAATAASGAADEPGSFTGEFTGELLYSEAPYGVGYHVATWTRPPHPSP